MDQIKKAVIDAAESMKEELLGLEKVLVQHQILLTLTHCVNVCVWN